MELLPQAPPIQRSSQHVQRPPSSLPWRSQRPSYRGEEWTASRSGLGGPCNDRSSSGAPPASRLWPSALRGHATARLLATTRPRRWGHAHTIWWLLPSTRSLWARSLWARAVWPGAVWPGARSIWACGRSDGSHGAGTPWDSYHSDRATGGDIPDSTRTDCVSPLPAAHHHPHQPQRGPHERCLLPLLLLCWV